jgi:hypothetical protein
MRRPDPDPTLATVALIKDSIAAFKDTVVARFDAIDKATEIFSENLTRVPTALDKALQTAGEFNEAKRARLLEHVEGRYSQTEIKLAALAETVSVFKTTVNERFQLSDIQTEKAARDVKSAVDAAFAAAKEAVGEQNKSNALSITKSETAFTKQIDQLADSVKSIVKNTDDKISDLKERVLANEGRSSVSDPATARALAEMATAIDRLSAGANIGTGRTQQAADGFAKNVSITAVVFGFVGMVGGIAGLLHAMTH